MYADELMNHLEKEESLDSLIEYNLVHLRPYFKLGYKDLEPAPIEPKAVITAESPVSLLAMKRLVKGSVAMQ